MGGVGRGVRRAMGRAVKVKSSKGYIHILYKHAFQGSILYIYTHNIHALEGFVLYVYIYTYSSSIKMGRTEPK